LDIVIELADADVRNNVVVKVDADKTSKIPLFITGDTCSGKVRIFFPFSFFFFFSIKIPLLKYI